MAGHKVPHDLGADKAKEVAVAAFAAYKEKYAEYKPSASWTSDTRADISFNIKGKTLNGTMQVNSKDIEMDLDVPFLFRPFKGKALSVIETEIQKWIEKARAGEI